MSIKCWYFAVALILLILVPTTSKLQVSDEKIDKSCPMIWSERNEEGNCTCGDNLNQLVKCDDVEDTHLYVRICYCMTESIDGSTAVVGHCMHTCYVLTTDLQNHGLKRVDSAVGTKCQESGRTGQLCGECAEGYALPVYSYDLRCVKCVEYDYNWLRYAAIAFLPATIFYIAIMISMTSINSGSMVACITLCQILTTPTILRYVFTYQLNRDSHLFQLITSVYAIWNLDVLKAYNKPFCLDPRKNILDILSLEYLVAVYPLLLILLTCALAWLHRRSAVVVWLFGPAYILIQTYHREWNINSSLLKGFGTFLVLSYVKILNTSAEILTPVTLRTTNGSNYGGLYLYYNSSMKFLGKEHLPYAVLAIVMITVFNLVPLLVMCLYPCKRTQQCLNALKIQTRGLHMVMDVFYGHYKIEPQDCCYIAVMYFLLRIVNISILMYLKGPVYIIAIAYVLLFTTIILAMTSPYRNPVHTTTSIVLFLVMVCAIFSLPSSVVLITLDPTRHDSFTTILFSLLTFPLFYMAISFLYAVLPKKVLHKSKQGLKQCLLKANLIQRLHQKLCMGKEVLEESLPHRLQENRGELTPLL